MMVFLFFLIEKEVVSKTYGNLQPLEKKIHNIQYGCCLQNMYSQSKRIIMLMWHMVPVIPNGGVVQYYIIF